MPGLHLRKRGAWWYYQRRRPERFKDVEPCSIIRFSLKTTDLAEARKRAADYSLQLDRKWKDALERGESLAAADAGERYAAAVEVNRRMGFSPTPISDMSDDVLLQRLRALIENAPPPAEQKAVLGMVEEPELSLDQAFNRFWEHIRDEWSPLSKDQIRVKRNAFLKAIKNFEQKNGPLELYAITRNHALAFRSWWVERIEQESLTPHTANRELSSLRRLIAVNYEIDAVTEQNPFHKVRLRDRPKQSRQPFSTEFIRDELLAPGVLPDLPPDLHLLIRLLVNTGMRPSEGVGLELADFNLQAEVPHVHVRSNGAHALKTDHSERQLPLVGVSLTAARAVVAQGGWGKWLGRNMYVTTLINRNFRETGLVTEKSQSLYSLRHWFQDQLTKRDVVDRAQAQLMGHKFQRPKYGFGKDLAELRDIIAAFAIE